MTLSRAKMAALISERAEAAMRRRDEAAALRRVVCEKHRITPAMLTGPRRHKRLVEARRDFAAIAKSLGHSYSYIARELNRDHTTIMHLLGVV